MDFDNLPILMNDHQGGMSDFQDDYFVTARAGGTPYGQYKQALREMNSRYRALQDQLYGDNGQNILALKIKKMVKKFEQEDLDDIEREILNNKIINKRISLALNEKQMNETKREFIRFYQQACYLKEQIGELTPERRREFEYEFWTYRVKELIAIDYLQHGTMKGPTIEFLTCLPKEIRSKLLKVGPKLIAEEYMHREEPYLLPFEEMELPQLEMQKIEKLIEWKEPYGQNNITPTDE